MICRFLFIVCWRILSLGCRRRWRVFIFCILVYEGVGSGGFVLVKLGWKFLGYVWVFFVLVSGV